MAESPPIVTGDPRFLAILEEIDRIASTPVPVLLEGESGTGKELIARRIHRMSGRSRLPFLPVNCAALCETLAESELFGHAAGAFTGAVRDRRGMFEEAGEGTLFLDEIGDLAPPIQAKLLRVLQEDVVRRVGESIARPVRFRLVAASHKNLLSERRAGRFRDDLFFRIHVIRVVLPPLRERRGDIDLLASAFLPRLAATCGKEILGLRRGVRRLLHRYDWPGTVRELENELKRAVALAEPGGWVERHYLSESIRLDGTKRGLEPLTLQEKLDKVERKEILRSLDRARGNKSLAARELGLSRQGLRNKLARYGIAARHRVDDAGNGPAGVPDGVIP